MITSTVDNYLTDGILEEYDNASESKKREAFATYAARSVAYAQLLEMQTRHDLGNGWAITRSPGGWNIYYRAKHVDVWNNPDVLECELTQYANVVTAIDVASDLAENAEWSR